MAVLFIPTISVYDNRATNFSDLILVTHDSLLSKTLAMLAKSLHILLI